MTHSQLLLLQLVRASLDGGDDDVILAEQSVDAWSNMIDLAFENGVSSITADGYQRILLINPNIKTPIDLEEMEDLRYEWLCSIFQAEEDYMHKLSLASRFASRLKQEGVICYVLKGLSFASYYEPPEYREFGDCDIYLGSDFEIGNEVAIKMGAQYEFGTYKHSHLTFDNLMFENHKYLTDFNGTKQGRKIEMLMQRNILEGPVKNIADTDLICPSDYFNALFLLKHAHWDFITDGMILRMIYDWAAFLRCCQDKIDWKRLNEDLIECRLLDFAKLMTSLCVDYLGIELKISEIEVCADKSLVEEVMIDTLSGGIHTKGKENFWKKCIRIFRRFLRLWHYRGLATESVPRMIWNSFAYSYCLKRKIEL